MISADQSTPANNFDFTVDGSARSQGIEASLTGSLTANLDVASTYAYTDAAYRQNVVYGGKRLPNVARHAMTFWGQYRWNDAWKPARAFACKGRALRMRQTARHCRATAA